MKPEFRPGQLVVVRRLWNDITSAPVGVFDKDKFCLYIRKVGIEDLLLYGDEMVVAYPAEIRAYDPTVHYDL